MAIQIINTGTSPNAGNGDSIRTAFNKVNSNFEYLEDIIVGTGTNIVNTIQDVVEPMLVHNLHQGLTAVYSTSTDRIVLSTNNSSATFQNIRVIQTATLKDVVMTGTVTMGFIRGYDDVSIVKFADDGSLNFRMLNTYGPGSAQINLLDRVSGSFNILHQNSEASFGDFLAGNNYIYDDAGRPINIGRNSNINFYSTQSWTSSTPAAMSIRNTGTILVNSTLSIASSSFVLGGKRISVIDNSIYVDNEKANASTDRLTAGNFTATLTTAGNVVLPGNAQIEYVPYIQPGNTVTNYGTVFNSDGPFAGVGSIYFDGADRVEVAGGSHFDLTADDAYTIEWFQKPTTFNTSSVYTVFTLGTANDNPIEAYNYYTFPNTVLAATLDNSFQLNATFTTTYLNTWSHVAIVKTTSSFSVFINGVRTISTNSELFPTPITTTSNLTIGAASNGFSYINPFVGYISNMRWEARAVYTATFVPPTSILTPSIHTRLLLATENSQKYLWDTGGLVPETAQKLKFSLTTSSLSLSSYGELYLDYGGAYDGSDVDSTTIRVDIDQPNYTQVFIKNHSAGTTATSDVMIFNDQGNPNTNYIDLGINSSNYSEGPFGIHAPGSGYLFTKDVDLVIGTQTPGTKLVFHAGGSTSGDAAGELNQYIWRFNRSVQTVVSTPGPLNFTVQNTLNNSAATAVYQAVNNASQYVQLGIQSTNAGAIDGQIGPGEAFLHLHDSTATLHIGDTGDIKFYSDTANSGYNGNTATLVMSRLNRSSTFGGNVLPAANLTYDLGSTSSQWRSLYVGTSTIYLGGVALSVSGGNLTLDGAPVVGGTGVTNPYSDPFVITNTSSNTTSDTGALVVAGGVGIGGNLHVQGYGHFGLEPTISYENPLGVFTNDYDGYSQVAIQNLSTGTSASADVVATADDGTDELYYINMGINNSNYDDLGWTISGPHDGYLYVSNGNLTLGTTEPLTYVKVHIGGTLEGNVVATFREPGTDSTSSFTGALTVDGGIGITGQMHLQETVHVGDPNLLLPNAVFIGARDIDDYVQLSVQNENPGASASSDFVATADNGDDTSKYIDLGINGSGYNNPDWTISGANDGYLYINGGNLTLGTDSTGTTVKIHVGGILAENVVATFDETTFTAAQHILPAADLTYDLGSTSSQWRSLYVGTSTVYFGGVPLTISAGGTLTVDGNPISGATPFFESTTTINITNTASVGILGIQNDIYINSADDIYLQAKNRELGDDIEGGDISIFAGNGASDNELGDVSAGGDIDIKGGLGGSAGTSANGRSGGYARFEAGNGGDGSATQLAGGGGAVFITAGDGGVDNGGGGATGGDINIVAGDSTDPTQDRGNIILTPGAGGDETTIGGYVRINIPTVGANPGGQWTFTGSGRTLEPPPDAEIFVASNGGLTVGSYLNSTTIKVVDSGLVERRWNFAPNGSLEFPDNTSQRTAWTGSATSLVSTATGRSITFDDSGDIRLFSPTYANGLILSRTEFAAPSNFVISSNNTATGAQSRLNFDKDGNGVFFTLSNTSEEVSWTFYQDRLRFSDGTSQYTAYTGIASPGTTATSSAVGYIGMPQNNQTSTYTVAITDQGKHIYCTGANFTVTIPANTVTSFPVGSSVAFIAGPTTTATITIQTDTMYLGGSGTTGTRTLAAFGMATAVKVDPTTWYISGTGLA